MSLHNLCRKIWEYYKTQMGTIISESSHSTAFYRSILQCQVTVIVPGLLP